MSDNNLNIKMKNSWEDLHSEERFQPKYPSEHVIRFMFTCFSRDLKEKNNLKILDLGCGAGSNTIFLAKEGFDAYATDVSENGLKVTNQRLKDANLKAILKNADMESQPFEADFFDGVISFGVFYYNTRSGYKKAVSEMRRILKKGGWGMVFSRTTDDYRFGKGREIEKNNFILNAEDTNEKDMAIFFLDRQEINEIFKEFSEIIVEKTETTFCNSEKKNSDWIIKVKK
jgi:ubiquinone/menaquinone biosynthesis C-methylase UbiE